MSDTVTVTPVMSETHALVVRPEGFVAAPEPTPYGSIGCGAVEHEGGMLIVSIRHRNGELLAAMLPIDKAMHFVDNLRSAAATLVLDGMAPGGAVQ